MHSTAARHGPAALAVVPAPADAALARLDRLVTVVIVAYRSDRVLPGALSSIPAALPIIVVDNAGRDRSGHLAAAAGATVLENTRNFGFGTACNQGAALADTPFILFLNPDARLSPGVLERLVAVLLEQPDLAATGPLLSAAGRIGLPRRSGQLDIGEALTFDHVPSDACDVGFLSGAALLVRTAAFRSVGGFDERIFLYLEDDDLCMRLRGEGWRLRLMPGAVVAHEKVPDKALPARTLREHNRHTMRSMRYVAGKHGIAVDFKAKRRQALKRLLLALLLMDRRRVHANLGRLQGLGCWPFSWRALPAHEQPCLNTQQGQSTLRKAALAPVAGDETIEDRQP
ncbi:MAG: glycosyltransferase family 2 protein [Pseudomonadota bacterium]